MIEVGKHHRLKVARRVPFGVYLFDGEEEVLLPLRFVPTGAQTGDEVQVFVYHDNDGRKIATTMQPKAEVGDIALLTCKSVTKSGAFLDWGIMKDVFIPEQYMQSRMIRGEDYLVYVYLDEYSGRVVATQKIDRFLSNEYLTVEEGDEVELLLLRRTDLGYAVIINRKHLGLLHESDILGHPKTGQALRGFVKKIREDQKIDVSLSQGGYDAAVDKEQQVMERLEREGGTLPFSDKSDPALIFETFGMSKKQFKMVLGSLYKKRMIELQDDHIRLIK